jgi:hypothetical protein
VTSMSVIGSAAITIQRGRGPRMYSWSWVPIPAVSGHRWVLVRGNDSTGELAYYLTFSPHPVPLRTLVRVAVAGQRWRVEESLPAKG